MVEIRSPKFSIGTDQRELMCRSEMKAIMTCIIRDAVKRGWFESEVTMCLADVAEDHILELVQKPVISTLRMISSTQAPPEEK